MFEITIKEISTVTKLTRGEHKVIEERPYTEEEMQEANRSFQSTAQLKRIYGYAPDREEEHSVEREVLKQSVDELDLAAVIKAVNKL